MRGLVIVVRGLHLGYVGCYGNEWLDTPTLDRLAGEGVVFDRHHADHPDPAGAAHAWRTGRYRFPADGATPPPVPPPGEDLLASLRAAGVGLALVADASRPGTAAFAEGWGDVTRVEADPAAEGPTLERTLEAVPAALERLAPSERWLLWVELATLLPPWEVPAEDLERYCQEDGTEEAEGEEEEDEAGPATLEPLPDPVPGPLAPPAETTFLRLQRTYAGAVNYVDARLSLLFDHLREQRLLDDLLVVVTADHGLPLGEHGVVGHGRPFLHDELIHLPLLVRLPGGAEAGRRVGALTQPVDLLPTLLDAFGLPPPAVHGRSLLPLLRGQGEPVRAYACAGLRLGADAELALRTPRWSFLLPLAQASEVTPRAPQLYVKPEDRWEVNNVLQHHLELAEHLEQTLRGFVEATRQPGPLQAPVLRDVETEQAPPAPDGGQP
jgi:arylsulfatase A-like enzyme